VYRIPRFALRNDDQIWLVDKEQKLAIRPVKTLWREEEYVYIRDGLHPDDLLIVSALATPVDGMDLRLEQEKDEIVGNVMKKQESSEQKQP
jgi:hypothetical protein